MRECEIDLVAEHGEASLSLGFRRADTFLSPPYRGVSGGRTLTGKAALSLFPRCSSRVKAVFEEAGECMFDVSL